MNRIYRLVFNHVLGVVQVAPEVCSTSRSGQHPATRPFRRLVLAPLSAALLLTGSLQATAQAILPQGQIIRSGSGTINVSGNVMTIEQASRASLIEWDSFNIGAPDTVQFNLLQGSQATAINLVTGTSGSIINGQLRSNGQVFLINQAGITFNAGASVNVGGLLASTLLPGTPGLLDPNGVSPTFQLAGGGTSAMISNNGATLSAVAGGISLIGGAVSNTGVISAAHGNIDLVAAGAATVMNGVSSSGMSQLRFLPTAASTITGTGISNAGFLNARNIGMNALMGPGLSSVGINTGGTIIADTIDAGDGSLTLRSSSAIQMSGGNINARSVDLTATNAVGLAGDITANDIAIQAGSVMQAAGAVQGTLRLDTQGSVNLAQAGNRITTVGGTVGAGLTLTTNTDLTNGAALSVGGTSTFMAGQAGSRRNITLTNAGNSFGGQVSLSAGNAELHADNLILGDSTLDGDLTLALSGGLGRGGLGQSFGSMLDVGGTTRIAAGTSIQLDNTDSQGRAVNRFGGPVSLSGGSSSIRGTGTLAFGNLDVGSVVATADTVKLPVAGRSIGLQYYQGAIELAGDTVLDSQLGEINFQGSVDGGYALTIARAAMDVVFGGNVGSNRALASLDIRNGGPLRLSGNITADGAIMLGNLSLSSATPQLFSVRSNSGNLQVGRIDGTSSGQSSLALFAHGTLDLQRDAGTLAGAGLNNLQLSGATVTTKAIRTSGRLDIASTSGFAQNGVLTVGGNASFTAGSGGDLTLDTEPNTFGGTVALQGRQARIGAQSALALKGIDVAALDASSRDSLSLADARIAGRAGLDAASLLIDDARIDGALTANARAGAIHQGSGNLVIGSNSQLTASNDIVLGNAGNQLGSALQASGHDIVLTSATALDLQQLQATRDATFRGNGVRLGRISAQGALSIDSSAAITQTDALQVDGNSRFVATDDISLAHAGNRFSGRVTLNGRNVSITAADGLLLDWVRARGTFDARAGNAGIGQSAALQVDGRSDLIASGAITLDRKDNLFGGVVTMQGSAVDIATAGALTLGDITTGQLKADADGNLRLTGRILADDVALATQSLFDNRVGANAIGLNGNGSWHIYLSSPTLAHTFGNLDSGNTALWNTAAFAGTSAGGNRYLFAWQPTLTFLANTLRKTYGDTLALGNAFSVSGAMTGALGAYKADDLTSLFTGTPEITSTGAAAGANVSGSPYQIDIRQGTLDTSASGYALAFAPGQLTIDPRRLIISAGNGNKTYGQNGGLGGYNANGLVNGDTLTSVDLGSGGTSATANVGNYTITASNADGTGLSNYDITYVDGTLSIGKAGLTITAGNGNKTYGQNGGLGGYAVDGLLNSDNVSSVVLGSNGSAATANVGDYTITASNADGTGLSNYDITYVDGVLSIGKAGLIISANNASRRTGESSPFNGYTAEGLVNGDTIDDVRLFSDGSDLNAQPGGYAILASDAQGARLGNYDITYREGTLDVAGVSSRQNLQIAREVAATLSRPAPRALTGSSDAPLYRLNEAAITPASDACTSLGQIQCLARQPE